MRGSNHIDIDINDPNILDRLVDAELTESQEREVISQLSQMPDGWRRCALAFLEARCWQRAARQVQELSSELGGPATTSLARPPKPAVRSLRWPGVLALCALFLLAFGVGSFLPNPWQRAAQPSTIQPSTTPLDPSGMQLVHDGPAPPAGDALGPQAPLRSQDFLAGNVTLVDNNGSPFEVPVYDWNEQVADQLMYRTQALSPEFVQQLKRHQVRSHRSYVPVTLQDGRRVVVPVDKVEIIPVGGTAY